MEESTCHEMVIDLLKIFSCMKCLFFALFHSFYTNVYDFYVDSERMIAKT